MSEFISSKNLEILTFIAACPAATAKYEALRIMFADDLIDERLESLENAGFVDVLDDVRYSTGNIVAPIHDIVGYRLTLKGRDALSNNDKLREKQAEQARKQNHDDSQRRMDRIESFKQGVIISVISAIVTAIVGIIVQHLF